MAVVVSGSARSWKGNGVGWVLWNTVASLRVGGDVLLDDVRLSLARSFEYPLAHLTFG
ncbi:MAG: hypothetical protein QXU75_08660 [Candidatus Methanomethylicaceae archaeon]